MEKNFDLILGKYLAGDDLNLEEIQLVESHLEANPILSDEIANKRSSSSIETDLAIGIDHWVTQNIKKDISKTEKELYLTGFFLNTTHIDQYLSGDLEGELATIFEKRLEEDESFVKEVEHQADIREGIDLFSERNIKNDLNLIESELEKEAFFNKTVATKKQDASSVQEGKVVKLGFRKILAYAASVLLLASAGLWFFNQNAVTTQDQFAMYFQPYQDVLTEEILDELESFGFGEVSEKEQLEALQKCMTLYRENSYNLSNAAFEDYLNKYPEDLEAKFYQSIALIKLKDYKKAISQLVVLQNKEEFRFKKESTWYLALAYLKNKQPDLANTLFEKISADPKSPFQKNSQKILNK